MVKINSEHCIGCKLCISDCPAGNIFLDNGVADVKKKCIECGHCVAICPEKAVSITEYEMEDVEEYKKDTFHINSNHFLHAIKFRRSIRNYKEKPIEQDKLNRILQVGRYTATAKNQQSVTFTLVQRQLDEFKALLWKEVPVIINELQTLHPGSERALRLFLKKWERNPEDDTIFFNATAVLVITAVDLLDGGLASANIENMAVAEELGVLYSGYMMRIIKASESLKEWLGIGDKEIASCMLMGYPDVSYKRTAPRRKADINWR